MTKAFESIKRGLRQGVRHSRNRRVGGLKLHVPPQDVKAVRERTRLNPTGSPRRDDGTSG